MRGGTTWYECPYDIVMGSVRCQSGVGTMSILDAYDMVWDADNMGEGSYDMVRVPIRHRTGVCTMPVRCGMMSILDA